MAKMNKLERENEIKTRVWNDILYPALVEAYGENDVLEVEPFTFCVPELDCENNECVLRIKLETPRKNTQGEEYDMYEAAEIYKAEVDKKKADKEAKEAKKKAEQEAKEKRKEGRAKARQANAKKVRKDAAANVEAEAETEAEMKTAEATTAGN